MLNINDYVEMTKEDFISRTEEEEWCPGQFGLKETCSDSDDSNECGECWKEALVDVEFFNPVIAFERNAMAVLDELYISEIQFKQLEEGRNNLKNKLMIMMEQYGVDKFENNNISITYVKGTTGKSFDSKEFKKDHKDLYDLYQKDSVRAASLRFKVK